MHKRKGVADARVVLGLVEGPSQPQLLVVIGRTVAVERHKQRVAITKRVIDRPPLALARNHEVAKKLRRLGIATQLVIAERRIHRHRANQRTHRRKIASPLTGIAASADHVAGLDQQIWPLAHHRPHHRLMIGIAIATVTVDQEQKRQPLGHGRKLSPARSPTRRRSDRPAAEPTPNSDSAPPSPQPG